MAVSEIEQATAVLRRGGVVAHATEGVWGLACDPRSDISVKKILDIKQREKENSKKTASVLEKELKKRRAELEKVNGLDEKITNSVF